MSNCLCFKQSLLIVFFCRIDADGHQNRWRPSSTPTNTFHEDRTPFPFLSLTALFLFCAPQSCTQMVQVKERPLLMLLVYFFLDFFLALFSASTSKAWAFGVIFLFFLGFLPSRSVFSISAFRSRSARTCFLVSFWMADFSR